MKALFLSALVFVAFAGPKVVNDLDKEVISQDAIDYINSVQSSWIASKEWVGDMTLGVAKSFASLTIKRSEFPEFNWGSLLNHLTVPESFDSRVQWPGCIHPVLDQGQCGSCWAFGATEVLSDRYCIASGGKTDVVLSPQYLVNCDSFNLGCNGGILSLAWFFLRTKGAPLNSCVPYTALDGTCPTKCADGSTLVTYKAGAASSYSTPASIQAAILEKGPIEVQFTVYQDFMSYSSGVYIHTYGDQLGGHAVKNIGWGVANGVNYWICQNSWGPSWGMQGFFWIGFGQCGIDEGGIAGNPA